MSRIYQSETQGQGFQASRRQVAGPVTAVSSDKEMRQLQDAIARDAATITKSIQRANAQANLELQGRQDLDRKVLSNQQQRESNATSLSQLKDRNSLKRSQTFDLGNFQASQLSERNELSFDQFVENGMMGLERAELSAQQNVARAKTQAINTSINALLSFAGASLQYAATQEADNKKTAQENAELESMGLGKTFGGAQPIPAESMESSSNTQKIIRAESEAINTATEDMAGGDMFERRTALESRQATLWKKLEPVRNDGYAAINMYRTALTEAEAAGLIRPGLDGMQDAQTFAREFARRVNLAGAPRDLQLKFARMAAAANENMVVGLTASHNTQVEQANLAMWKGATSNIVDASTPQTAGAAFETIREELAHSNSGFNGRVNAATTQAALAEQLANYKTSGKKTEIRALRDHVYNTATGRTLGQDYDGMFDAAEKEAERQSIQNFNLKADQRAVQLNQTLNEYRLNPSPETRASTINQLLNINTAESIAAANNLLGNGLQYDSKKAIRLRLLQQQGIEIPRSQLVELESKGIITNEEFKEFAASQPVMVATGKVDTYLKSISTATEKGMYGKVNPSDVNASQKLSLANRHKMLMQDLKDRTMNIVRANPSIADDPTKLATIVDQEAQRLIQQPYYKLEQLADSSVQFAGALPNGRAVMHITRNGNQDFSKFTAQEAIKNFPRSSMQASKDQFLTPTQLQKDAEALINRGQVSQRTKDFAKALQMDERVFVEAQLAQRGLPTLGYMQQAQANPMPAEPTYSADLNINTGYQMLRDKGVPRMGAAYIAGNIQQESTWNGMRSWGQVMGDGTNRNGGLVSWASWAGNSARLGRIETYFARDIAQITEPEQIEYMLYEMKQSYPEAYGVFMNPNSSPAELRAASYKYWGYGHEGKRYEYATNLLSR